MYRAVLGEGCSGVPKLARVSGRLLFGRVTWPKRRRAGQIQDRTGSASQEECFGTVADPEPGPINSRNRRERFVASER